MRKVLLIIGAVSILALVLVLALVTGKILSRSEGPQTTNTSSSSYETQQQKITFLQHYVVCPSPVLATEFHIQYWNNSGGGVPGPSEWDIRFAVKVPLQSISNWTKDFHPVHPNVINSGWWADLPLTANIWTRHSVPKYYQRPDSKTYQVVYEDEGIIFKRVSTL